MSKKIINYKDIKKGDHIIIKSPIENDAKFRHGYVLNCDNPMGIIIQMITSKDNKNLCKKIKFGEVEGYVKLHYQIKLNIYLNNNAIKKIKKDNINESQIEMIYLMAKKENELFEKLKEEKRRKQKLVLSKKNKIEEIKPVKSTLQVNKNRTFEDIKRSKAIEKKKELKK
ncbi:hypothetical protein SCORR_v1c10180 (plasmid) [Spiroplasma corruscae]|uniref:Uncharacterized protein n=1 Tax=Spiroplasma corruscae TaxID=216934 RepID=A0A222EQI3_9MOLU|nr:hypothetical protein [Spiroplasma corruscae]ASP28790.1 hypothetical protein SCORR_v1c10180 [Spiroplasma corruscae]